MWKSPFSPVLRLFPNVDKSVYNWEILSTQSTREIFINFQEKFSTTRGELSTVSVDNFLSLNSIDGDVLLFPVIPFAGTYQRCVLY